MWVCVYVCVCVCVCVCLCVCGRLSWEKEWVKVREGKRRERARWPHPPRVRLVFVHNIVFSCREQRAQVAAKRKTISISFGLCCFAEFRSCQKLFLCDLIIRKCSSRSIHDRKDVLLKIMICECFSKKHCHLAELKWCELIKVKNEIECDVKYMWSSFVFL